MPFSVGIEIEGVALSRATPSTKPLPTNVPAQLNLIADALSAAGMPARTYLPLSNRGLAPDYTIWNVAVDATINNVTSDTSDSSSTSHYGFELVSPIFYDTDATAWREVFCLGVRSVGNAVLWKTNSTGLHIHIGCGFGEQFSLHGIKKIAMLCCLFEATIGKLMPTQCVEGNGTILSNRYNAKLYDLPLHGVYARILGASSTVEICELMNGAPGVTSHHGYSGSRFFKHDTIEFNQHTGTTNPEQMMSWIDFTIRFVKFAINTRYEEIWVLGDSVEELDKLVGLP
ncbi:hypothetical protein B7463_g2578, partial [Scytalidium lignicola]